MVENPIKLTPKRFKEILMTVLFEARGLPKWMQEDAERVDKQNRGWPEEVPNEEKT